MGESRGTVVTYLSTGLDNPRNHEAVTRAEIARRLAMLKRFEFGGEYDQSVRYPGPVYFLPRETVIGIEHAATIGILSEKDLFGGVAPHRFVATKSITHPLVDDAAHAPEGWSREFAGRVAQSVLKGFTAFSHDDARRAAQRLLQQCPVRIKRSLGIGGQGQFEVDHADKLDGLLERIDADEIAEYGVAVEENLAQVTTCSVGQVRVEGFVASYYGTQQLTRNNEGGTSYGGSELLVVRGDFDALLAQSLSKEARLAVAQARAYDDAAAACFDGFFASRRNYDIAQGCDRNGNWHSGVLEQSWRVGGASGAEMGALEAFERDPQLQRVRAKSVEVYGKSVEPPADATVYFHGDDEKVGPLTKYTVVTNGDDR
jgi:hypothetical protein